MHLRPDSSTTKKSNHGMLDATNPTVLHLHQETPTSILPSRLLTTYHSVQRNCPGKKPKAWFSLLMIAEKNYALNLPATLLQSTAVNLVLSYIVDRKSVTITDLKTFLIIRRLNNIPVIILLQ